LTIEEITDIVDLVRQEKCSKPLVLTVERNARFLSNQQKEDLYIAGNVIRSIGDSRNPSVVSFRPLNVVSF